MDTQMVMFETDEYDRPSEQDERLYSIKISSFRAKQDMPYEWKKHYAKELAKSFYDKITLEMGANVHISVGGLDSITLFYFLRDYCGLNVYPISVSSLEDKSIQRIHKKIGVENLEPYKTKTQVLQEFGFPVLSKEKANKIYTLHHPTSENRTLRNAIMTGDCGAQGHYKKNSKMKLPQKWLQLFAGVENANYGTHYKTAPFKVSSLCCKYMKEDPCNDWAKQHNSHPYLGLMASEGGQREKALIKNGCNYYSKDVVRSCPFAIFKRQDLLQLALELKVPIPEIYGQIEKKPDGTLFTTLAQRTGCSMCGFGIHFEKRPHRFDRLRASNPAEWELWMYRCVTDEKTGEKYGWGRVLDYIGVEWENPIGALKGQIGFLED